MRELFEAPTVAGMALRAEAALREGVGTQAPPLVPVPRDGSPLPLSFAQQRLWFIDQLEPGSSAYNLTGAWRLEGALDEAALERSLGEIVRRHEARSEEHTSELQSRQYLVCRLLLEKKNNNTNTS